MPRGSNVCAHFQEFLTMLSPPKMPRIASKSPKKRKMRFDALPWQQYFRYQYSLHSFTSAVFLQYSDEVWSKLCKSRWWIQSIFKMTHFLLPVGGAITLPHNCHINAIGLYTEQTDEIYMCTEFHINTWKYVWATHQVFWWVPGGAVEPLCHAWVPASAAS